MIKNVLAGISVSALTLALLTGLSTPANAAACSASPITVGTGADAANAYQISTPGQLQWLTLEMNGGSYPTAGKHYKITADINFAGCDFTPSSGGQPFKGSVDGQNFKIQNFNVTVAGYAGIFGQAHGAVLKNITIADATITSTGAYVGALVGLAIDTNTDGTGTPTILDNILVIDSSVRGDSSYTGGIAGTAFGGSGDSLNRLRVIDTRVSGGSLAGGLIGSISGYPTLKQAGFFGGEVVSSRADSSNHGGLVGVVQNVFTLSKSAFRSKMDLTSGQTADGGFLVGYSMVDVTIEDSYARGTAKVLSPLAVAGLVRGSSGNVTILRSYVQAEIRDASDTAQVSSIAFAVANGTVALTNSFVDTQYHSVWTGVSGAGKTSSQLLDSITFTNAGYSHTSDEAQIANGSATQTWYSDSTVDYGHMFLAWEFLGMSMSPCAVGRYSATGYGDCRDAKPGHFVAFTGRTSQTPCTAGSFQANFGAFDCIPAPEGTFVSTTRATIAIDCPAGTYQNQAGQTSCLPAQPGFFVASAGSAAQDPCPAGTTSLAANATACTPVATATYSGPTITSTGISAQAGSTVNLLGSELSSVTGVTVDGLAAEIVSKSSTSITIRVPAVTAGLKDLIVASSSGTLTVQGALRVVAGEEVTTQLTTASIKRIGNSVRLFVSEPAGLGKIQFKINGREIAWVRAVDATDPKLRTANGLSYFVRLAALGAGKNGVEIYVDGTRVKRVAYTR